MHVYLFMLGSSGDSEDCAIGSQGLRVPTQKSYSSSETLKAFDQHQDQTRSELGTEKQFCVTQYTALGSCCFLFARTFEIIILSLEKFPFSSLHQCFTVVLQA